MVRDGHGVPSCVQLDSIHLVIPTQRWRKRCTGWLYCVATSILVRYAPLRRTKDYPLGSYDKEAEGIGSLLFGVGLGLSFLQTSELKALSITLAWL